MPRNTAFQQHIHVFRAVAIILIVWTHVASSLSWSPDSLTGRLIRQFGNEASICFVFVAGYLFQVLSADYAYEKYLRQKLKVVIIPYLVMSLPAILIFSLVVQREGMWPWFADLSAVEKMGLFILTGKHLAPYWFIPMIAIFYIAAPLFIYIDRKMPKVYWSIIPLMALSFYLGRDGPYGPLSKAIYMLPIYLLGMAFSRYRAIAEKLVSRFWPMLLALCLFGYWAEIQDWPHPPSYQFLMKTSGTMLLVLLLLNSYRFVGNRLNYLSDVSFGIYFIHSYVISASKIIIVAITAGTITIRQLDGPIAGSVPVFVVYLTVVMLVCVGIIKVAQKIFGKGSRYLIGA